jgi:hypothetical protein
MQCKAILTSRCAKNHKVTRKCHDKAAAICRKCEAEARAAEARRQRDHKLDQERQTNQARYAAKLAEIEDEIEHQRQLLSSRAEEQERRNALTQKRQDLENMKKKAKAPVIAPEPSVHATSTSVKSHEAKRLESGSRSPQSSANTSPPIPDRPNSDEDGSKTDWDKSTARNDWEEQKELWGAENEALDSLMPMIGKCLGPLATKAYRSRSRECQRAVSCHQKQDRYPRPSECAPERRATWRSLVRESRHGYVFPAAALHI